MRIRAAVKFFDRQTESNKRSGLRYTTNLRIPIRVVELDQDKSQSADSRKTNECSARIRRISIKLYSAANHPAKTARPSVPPNRFQSAGPDRPSSQLKHRYSPSLSGRYPASNFVEQSIGHRVIESFFSSNHESHRLSDLRTHSASH